MHTAGHHLEHHHCFPSLCAAHDASTYVAHTHLRLGRHMLCAHLLNNHQNSMQPIQRCTHNVQTVLLLCCVSLLWWSRAVFLQFWYGLVRGPAQPGHTDAAWVLPVVVGAAAVLVAGQALKAAEASGALQLQALRDDWPAWSATLLLILQPLHQLVRAAGEMESRVRRGEPDDERMCTPRLGSCINTHVRGFDNDDDNQILTCLNADDLHLLLLCRCPLLLLLLLLHVQVDTALHPAQLVPDSSVGQLVLLLLANGLMVPRALFTRQFMMFTGTCSGALLAAGQLLMVALHSISCTLRLPTAALGASSAALASSGSAWSVPFGVLMHLHSSRDGCMLSGTCGLPALTVAALVVWLWLCLAVLHQGWQWIKAHQ